MKNKILLTFLLIGFILLIPSACHAFSVETSVGSVDLGNIELKQYVFVIENSAGNSSPVQLLVYTSDEEFFTNTDNNSFKFDSSYIKYIYWFSNKRTFKYEYGSDVGSVCKDPSFTYLYSNFDFKDTEGNLFFENSERLKFNLTVEPTEKTTNVPVKIHTDWYTLDEYSDIVVKYSYDQKNWKDCDWGRYMNPSTGQEESLWRFEVNAYNNDTYYFQFVDLREMRYEYKTIVIDNIIYTQDNPRRLY